MPYTAQLLDTMQRFNDGLLDDREALVRMASILIDATNDTNPTLGRDGLMTFLQQVFHG